MRFYLKNIVTVFVSLSIIFVSTSKGDTQEQKYKLNGNYQKVGEQTDNRHDKNQTTKVEITEFFLYSCPPCFELDPKLNKWVQDNKERVVFNRIPAVVSSSWVPLAKAYYVAEKLGILKKTHTALFDAIHKDKRIFLNEYSLSGFYEKYGVDKYQFINLYNSQEIIDKVSDARLLTVKYNLRGVPAVVMAKRYKTAPFFNRDQEQMLDVMSFLLKKIIGENLRSIAK